MLLKSQFVTSSLGDVIKMPYALREQVLQLKKNSEYRKKEKNQNILNGAKEIKKVD